MSNRRQRDTKTDIVFVDIWNIVICVRGGDKDLPCVKAIIELAKEKNIKLNDKDFNFEKLLTEDL